jgi:hypothetical protein
MNKKLWYVFGVMIILIMGYYLYYQIQLPQSPSVAINATSTVPTSIPDWNTCNYPGFGFKLQYPANWVVSVISKAQGGGNMGPIVTTCGKIDASSLLGQISFGPSVDSVGMTITIRDSRDETLDQTKAKNLLISTNSATYNGRQYVIAFSKGTSTTVQNNILQTFEFVSQ